jgi:hypothetical protein
MSRSYWKENQQIRVALRVHCAGADPGSLACALCRSIGVPLSLSLLSLLSLSPLSLSRLLSRALSFSKFRYQFCQNYQLSYYLPDSITRAVTLSISHGSLCQQALPFFRGAFERLEIF